MSEPRRPVRVVSTNQLKDQLRFLRAKAIAPIDTRGDVLRYTYRHIIKVFHPDVGSSRGWKMRARTSYCGLGLHTAGSGFCKHGCLCSKIIVWLRIRPAGLAQNSGPRGLRLLACVVKTRARPGPIQILDKLISSGRSGFQLTANAEKFR
jgi:hypothetical protein